MPLIKSELWTIIYYFDEYIELVKFVLNNNIMFSKNLTISYGGGRCFCWRAAGHDD